MSSQLSGQRASEIPPQNPRGIWTHSKTAFRWLVTYPSRLSTAARAAWILFFVLILLVVIAWTLFCLDDNNGPWVHLISPQWIAVVAALTIAIPFVAYRGLRLWLQGDVSMYPEVDYAWKAGLDALEQHGIDIRATPVFLILGSTGEEQEEALLRAAGRKLRVANVPEGPAPIHWYANPDAIYVFATEASWLSGMAALKECQRMTGLGGPGGLSVSQVAQQQMESTASNAPASAPAPAAPTAPSGGEESEPPRGTIMLDQFVSQRSATEEVAAESSDAVRGTMTLPEGERTARPGTPNPLESSASRLTMVSDFVATSDTQGPAVLSPQEGHERAVHLEYICQMLARVRSPVCPVNGVVMLLPFELVKGMPAETEQAQSAIRSDLNVVQRELKLRCPVTCLISGMEHERGFRELGRRVGRDMAAAQRFGQKFDICQPTTQDQIVALSAHVCGAFEDWIYTLFREEDALTRAGNTRLYGLLCKVRCMLKTRLTQILMGGFGYDPDRNNGTPIAFSGCYFAATGATSDKQAFVRGIFDKLNEEQEFVEWSNSSIDDSRWRKRFATFGILLNVALAIVAVTMSVRKVT